MKVESFSIGGSPELHGGSDTSAGVLSSMIKQERIDAPCMFGSDATGHLDMLAMVASNQLEGFTELRSTIKTEPIGMYERSTSSSKRRKGEDKMVHSGHVSPPPVTIRVPRRLEDHTSFSYQQISRMSLNTVLRLFMEPDFDEIRKLYRYKCCLMPESQCGLAVQSFGSETKAKIQMKSHLQGHIKDTLKSENYWNFSVEPVAARKKRLKSSNTFTSLMSNLLKTQAEKAVPTVCEDDNAPSSIFKVKTEWCNEFGDVASNGDLLRPPEDIVCQVNLDHSYAAVALPAEEEGFRHKSVNITSSVSPSRANLVTGLSCSDFKVSTVVLPEEDDREASMALDSIKDLRSRGSATNNLTCLLCQPPKSFTAYTTLLSHLRSHAGLRPYECHLCGAAFTRQHSLKYHLLVHKNETRFTCEDCNRKFRHPSHYKQHIQSHTAASSSSYSCSRCHIKYKTRIAFKRHLWARHDDHEGEFSKKEDMEYWKDVASRC